MNANLANYPRRETRESRESSKGSGVGEGGGGGGGDCSRSVHGQLLGDEKPRKWSIRVINSELGEKGACRHKAARAQKRSFCSYLTRHNPEIRVTGAYNARPRELFHSVCNFSSFSSTLARRGAARERNHWLAESGIWTG